LIHFELRTPDSQGESRRFDTLPSSSRASAWSYIGTVADMDDATPHETSRCGARRIIPAVPFDDYRDGVGGVLGAPVYGRRLDAFRRLFREGRFALFAEISAQYNGLSPADESLEPYFALAEELDVPVGIHMGEGPPGAAYFSSPKYRARLTSPFLLEELLVRHPAFAST
jgi:hypothetical protein